MYPFIRTDFFSHIANPMPRRYPFCMETEECTARFRLPLTRCTVEILGPSEASWAAWDGRLTSFGVRVQLPSLRSFIINYRPGDGERKASDKRVVIRRYRRVFPDSVRENRGEPNGNQLSGPQAT